MKLSRFYLAASIVLVSSSAQSAVLDVNLGQSGLTNEPGFSNWTTGDNSTPAATIISGIGLSVTIQASDSGGGTQLRSINRTDAFNGSLDNLTESWWGVRASASGTGGQFTLIVDGSDLGVGDFIWTSWHHDHDNQSGVMDIEFSVDGGSNFTLGEDDLSIISNATDSNVGAPNPGTFNFTSNGTDDIHIRFTNVVSNNSGEAFALLNGFRVEAVPEPSSSTLFCLSSLALMLRRKR